MFTQNRFMPRARCKFRVAKALTPPLKFSQAHLLLLELECEFIDVLLHGEMCKIRLLQFCMIVIGLRRFVL